MITYEIDIDSDVWEGSVFKNGFLIATIIGVSYEDVEDQIIAKYYGV